MTVYVDNARNRYGRMVMSHMLADTEAELHRMAEVIGIARRWYQGDHYDICQEKKEFALRCGAIEVTARAAVGLRAKLRQAIGATA